MPNCAGLRASPTSCAHWLLQRVNDALNQWLNMLPLPLQNAEVLRDLKFGIGDGQLHYYLYNWRISQPLTPGQVGLILM